MQRGRHASFPIYNRETRGARAETNEDFHTSVFQIILYNGIIAKQTAFGKSYQFAPRGKFNTSEFSILIVQTGALAGVQVQKHMIILMCLYFQHDIVSEYHNSCAKRERERKATEPAHGFSVISTKSG